MLRLGLKITHDGGFAVLDDNRLVVSHEAEKSANLPRHATLGALDVEETLAGYGIALDDVDRVLVDGWIDERAELERGDSAIDVPVAPYHESAAHRDPLQPVALRGLPLAGRSLDYLSYTHAAGHVLGTYAASPWARTGEDALVLVWDGAMLPRLYRVDPREPACTPLRRLFGFIGHVYPVFGSYFGPFRPSDERPATHDDLPAQTLLDLSGKVMAWVGLGSVNEDLVALFEQVYKSTLDLRREYVFQFSRTIAQRVEPLGVPDEDVVASFQAFVGRMLVDSLAKALGRDGTLPRRLCFTGGCALNIAWNAQLRASGLFEDVYVPPFPNDAGSALGCAAADLIRCGGGPSIDWDVYRGPELVASEPLPDWTPAPCDLDALAALLHESNEPVVFLNGRAELGPRALGNRSILCSAVLADRKPLLNEMKRREWYRPVAPICLESDAPSVFEPGTPDPYMLFTHTVRPAWRDRVPAIVHVDGTARLQTINERQNPVVARLLTAYRAISGVPLLCNTSANLKGSGFFPDLRSALAWEPARHVWCDGVLYSRSAVPAAAAAAP